MSSRNGRGTPFHEHMGVLFATNVGGEAWRGVEGGSEEKFSKESLESEGSDFG